MNQRNLIKLENQVKTIQQANKLEVTGEFNKETNNKFTELLVEKANKHDHVLDKLINIFKIRDTHC